MIRYRVDPSAVHAHRYRVHLVVPHPAAEQRLSLPVWIPGSYLVREFARHVSGVRARQGSRDIELRALDKATWLASTSGVSPLVVSYEVYAFDTSVRAAFLDANRGFFNGTSVFLRAEGREHEPHRLDLARLPEGWDVATTLADATEPAGSSLSGAAADGAGADEDAAQAMATAPLRSYQAANYDELVDHPVELGRFWRGRFAAAGIDHEFVVAGALPDFDGERLLADVARICQAQIAFWHPRGEAPPFARYLFLLNATEEGHGGLEHRSSTALIAPRRDLPRRPAAADALEATDGYVGLLGLISHEYFHTWNVKRLRPREFERYVYDGENYTELLWFFEGFTSYYDDLFLRRCGLVDESRYLKLLSRTVANVAATPGRLEQSVAQASFDAWIKYYRADENTPNATISYYAKGSLVALALDLSLRAEGRGSLDDVMRVLWETSAGALIGEADIAAALQSVSGRSYADELASWVHGTTELPLRELLAAAGVDWSEAPATFAQRLGVRVSESALMGIKVTHVLRGGVAEGAGLAAGDEIMAVDGWRLRRLDDAARLVGPAGAGRFLIGREQRVLTLDVPAADPAGATAGSVALKPAAQPTAAALVMHKAWLSG